MWIPPSTPKNITTIPYNFISTLLNANFDFDVSVANDVAIDVAIDVAKCALPGKVMLNTPVFVVDTSFNPQNITIPYHFISTLVNVNFDFDVSIANDVDIDVA